MWEQNDWQLADRIFKSIFFINLCILILIPQTFIPKSPESKWEWLNCLNILFYLVQGISGQAQHVRKYFIHSDLSIYFHAGASSKVKWIKLVSTNEFSSGLLKRYFFLEWWFITQLGVQLWKSSEILSPKLINDYKLMEALLCLQYCGYWNPCVNIPGH